jgi:hypothetical protein
MAVKMRMPVWAEIRWILAGFALDLAYTLMRPEMGLALCESWLAMLKTAEPDPKYNTVLMRKQP